MDERYGSRLSLFVALDLCFPLLLLHLFLILFFLLLLHLIFLLLLLLLVQLDCRGAILPPSGLILEEL